MTLVIKNTDTYIYMLSSRLPYFYGHFGKWSNYEWVRAHHIMYIRVFNYRHVSICLWHKQEWEGKSNNYYSCTVKIVLYNEYKYLITYYETHKFCKWNTCTYHFHWKSSYIQNSITCKKPKKKSTKISPLLKISFVIQIGNFIFKLHSIYR